VLVAALHDRHDETLAGRDIHGVAGLMPISPCARASRRMTQRKRERGAGCGRGHANHLVRVIPILSVMPPGSPERNPVHLQGHDHLPNPRIAGVQLRLPWPQPRSKLTSRRSPPSARSSPGAFQTPSMGVEVLHQRRTRHALEPELSRFFPHARVPSGWVTPTWWARRSSAGCGSSIPSSHGA
jgi:hypothetical protein